MVIEMVASRIIAPYLGSSLYTWTSVIGVVLTGITVGNYAGGVIAERGSTWKTVGYIFAFSGFATILSFFTYEPAHMMVKAFELPIQASALLFSLLAFFPLAFLLSLITPIVITLTLKDIRKTGTTIGSVYAVSAFASIMGTFVAGYWLIAWIGVQAIVSIVAGVLLLTGILAAREKSLTASAPMIFAVGLLWLSFMAPPMCLEETSYYCINIHETEYYQELGKSLLLDHLVHSYVFEDPKRIEYDYEVVYAVATEYVAEGRSEGPLRALFIGGGGYVMPRYIHANYEGAAQTVLEIDPGVTEAVVKHLGLDPSLPIENVNGDARLWLADHADGRTYDIVYGDAFNDFSVPFHLTTKEFVELVHARTAPHGIYAMNVIDDYRFGGVLSSFIATLEEVFPYVEVAPLDPNWTAPRRNTYVLIASNEPIDREAWKEAGRRAYAERLAGPVSLTLEEATFFVPRAEVEAFLAERRSLVLTDDYVPIDHLTAPLFRAMGTY
jgi:spermidine synthase